MVKQIDLPSSQDDDVAIYLPDLSGGGAERLHVQIAPMLQTLGFRPRLLLDRAGGALFAAAQGVVPIDILGARRQLAALPRLVRHLRQTRPRLLIANTEHMNLMAVLAARIARSGTAVVITQHNSFSHQAARPNWQFRILPLIYGWALRNADAVVAVSQGVADDLAARFALPAGAIEVIHNGVITDDFDARAAGSADHPWFSQPQPIVMAMGRFVAQKDFPTLIRAFAAMSAHSDARLMILGEGPLRGELEQLARQEGVADRVAMPGFVDNPLPWLKRARLFVMSSAFEGFGNVLCEALACGVPVVSTDCPSGPAEILEGGRYGRLVPVGHVADLAAAMGQSLMEEPDRTALAQRGRMFSVAVCAQAYAQVLKRAKNIRERSMT